MKEIDSAFEALRSAAGAAEWTDEKLQRARDAAEWQRWEETGLWRWDARLWVRLLLSNSSRARSQGAWRHLQ